MYAIEYRKEIRTQQYTFETYIECYIGLRGRLRDITNRLSTGPHRCLKKKSSRVPTPRELSRVLDITNTCVGNKYGRQTFRKHDF